MTTILYMVGALLLINGILVMGRGNAFGAVLMVLACAIFLVNVLRLMNQRTAADASGEGDA